VVLGCVGRQSFNEGEKIEKNKEGERSVRRLPKKKGKDPTNFTSSSTGGPSPQIIRNIQKYAPRIKIKSIKIPSARPRKGGKNARDGEKRSGGETATKLCGSS